VLAGQMRTDMLACHGGPFAIGWRVELGDTKFAGKVPEIEDRLFDASAARAIEPVPASTFWQLLTELAATRLADIFGPDLQPIGAASCGVLEYNGLRSLGCYWAGRPAVQVQPAPNHQRIRFSFEEGERRYNVPVTDIRLYAEDHVTPLPDAVQAMHEAIARHARVLLSVGLSRAFKSSDDRPAVHWLQVNNLHLPPT
jgi:hypothetical protein